MKKFTKVCLIIAVVLLVIGAGTTIVAASMGASIRMLNFPVTYSHNSWWGPGDWGRLRNDWSEIQDDWNFSMAELDQELQGVSEEVKQELEADFVLANEESFEDVKHLDVDIEAGTVQMITVDTGDQIQVRIGEGQNDYRLTMEGNTLKIKSYWRNRHLDRNDRRQIQILVPKDYQFNKVDIDVSAGLFITEALLAEELDVEMKAGAVWISGGNVKRFEGDCKAGMLSYSGYAEQKVKADCSAGKIAISILGKETDYNYKISTSAGSIIVGNRSYTTLRQKRQVTNDNAQGEMELKCSAGAVSVTFADSF